MNDNAEEARNDNPKEKRRHRWRGIVGVSVARLWNRPTRTSSSRILTSITVVALTIALLLCITGVALALADGGPMLEDDADAQIAPEGSGSLSAVDGVESPRIGESNERAAAIRSEAGIDHASPVLVEPTKFETSDGGSETVLLVGVVPDEESRTVAGLSTDGLEPGDDHYADGSYDGPTQRQLVLSPAAADRLEASDGDERIVSSGQTDTEMPPLTVSDVDDAAGAYEDSDAPIALVHLSELQTFSGASDDELADSVLVWGDSEATATAAGEAYPDATVESNQGGDPSALFDDGLAFATSAIALLIGVTICASFVATTMGMAVDQDRRTLAILQTIGVPLSGRMAVVATSTVVATLCGAVLGISLGVAGIFALNAVAGATVASGTVAMAHPVFVPYALAVALVAGLLAMPYPLLIASRTNVLAEVGR
ncbi:FtsX-like permease family protein [Halostagnicola sp. A-GB9-2]|uniref:ABC transporter permease n=1 Tax=Halostagnicola sp. A-GB9-2 TaxID=3048066 RepID=UPI0024BF9555|nr:FtsX-like permease family protein [Halostagnicola sp. A-GB9-2]MDJ1431252.1 ABC transporter permease [Halostagnicola sp. A-GB9-2]